MAIVTSRNVRTPIVQARILMNGKSETLRDSCLGITT